jgi:hypothetical protein
VLNGGQRRFRWSAHRKEIASLEDKKEGYAKVLAAQEKVAATAREGARSCKFHGM